MQYIMESTAGTEDLQQQSELLRQQLLAQLSDMRKLLGLTQHELAARSGLTRMTVQRAEGEGGNVSLGSFLDMSLALGLTPRLLQPGESVSRLEHADAVDPHPAHLVHRGYHHNRTKYDLDWDDRRREAALAQSWEAINKHTEVGLSPVMQHLVPGHTQAQASAVATAIQWLGSEVGFDFLSRALDRAGYEIRPKTPSKERGKR